MALKKEFKTLDQQIDILKGKGLVIENVDKVKKILFRENYFFINGYRYIFYKSKDDRTFIEGTSFDELYAFFLFDRNIRNIMFKNILIVENNIKSVMSYIMSKKYGIREKDYLKFTNFSRDSLKTRKVNDVLGKMKRQIKINSKQHSATLHYIMNYGYIPMWILVKVLSFGIVSELYSILRNEDMEEIANYYEINPNELEIFLSVTANYRNLCAHEDILFDHKTQRNIPDTKYHQLLNIPKVDGEYVYGKNDFFSVIIIMKHLLTKEEFRLLIYEIGYEIDLLDGKVSSIPLSKILHRVGFVENWRDILE